MRRPALRCALALTLVLTWSQIAPGCAQGDDVDGVQTTTTGSGQGGAGGEGGQLLTTSGAGGGAPCDPDESCGVCGNNVLEMGEECDDGNTAPGDGCDAACNIEPSTCNPDGVYMVQGAPLAYTCCFNLVNLNISSFIFTSSGVSIASSPSNPTPLIGSQTTCPAGDFINNGTITGGCSETYLLNGGFTDADTWSGTYSVSFSGADCDCFGGADTPCVNQTFPVTAVRQ